MLSYIVRRLLALVPILLGLSLIVFLIMALIPGDPALAILGSYATPESLASLRAQMGLDRPLPVQYLIWLDHIVHGDLGRSYSLNRPVLDEVVERFGATLILSTTAFVLCSIWGVMAGVVCAVRQSGWVDRLVTLFVLIGISIPPFWLGLLLILLFAVRLQWLPASGMFAIYGGGDLLDLAQHLLLPATTLSVIATGVVARLNSREHARGPAPRLYPHRAREGRVGAIGRPSPRVQGCSRKHRTRAWGAGRVRPRRRGLC